MKHLLSWKNLGHLDQDIYQYNEELAKGNMSLLVSYSAMSAVVFILMLAFRCLVNMSIGIQELPLAAGAVCMAILHYECAGRLQKETDFSGKVRGLLSLFCCIWFLIAAYYDIILHSGMFSVMPCMTLLAMPCLFDFIPSDGLMITMAAYAFMGILEILLVEVSVRTTDLSNMAFAAFIGLVIGWNKASRQLDRIHYLDLFRTIGVLYERAFSINLKTHGVRLLQGSKEFQKLCRETTNAEELIQVMQSAYIADEFRDQYLRFVDLNTMGERLRYSNTAELEYKDVDGIWHRATLIAKRQDRSSDTDLSMIVLVVRNINSQKLRELNYQEFLKKAATDAEHENSQKADYLRRISHDIRTTINGMCGVLMLGERYPDDLERQTEGRRIVMKDAQHLQELLSGVMDINNPADSISFDGVTAHSILSIRKDGTAQSAAADGCGGSDSPEGTNGADIAAASGVSSKDEDHTAAGRKISGELTPEEIEKRLRGTNVLLVEDNDINMEVAEFILEDSGVQVTKAWDGKEAVQLFKDSKEGTFQLILMDLMMPQMNGLDASRMIRASKRSDSNVPIIAMTANAFLDDRENCLKAGMNDQVTKPVSPDRLTAKMAEFL